MVKNVHLNENIEYGLILMDCSMPVIDGFEASE
jgi:CheY-like chemotaxis protein